MAKPAYKSSRKDSRKSRPPRKNGAGRAGEKINSKLATKNAGQADAQKRSAAKPSLLEQIPPRIARNGDRMPETTGMVLRAEPNGDYALIDSGNGEKLERYGPIVIRRPEGQAIWLPSASSDMWENADAVFSGNTDEEGQGRWNYPKGDLAETWPLAFDGLPYHGRFTSFRHTGVFPEQAVHWRSMDQVIRAARKKGRSVRMLNLFGYTGLASLVAAKAGAEVTHVDASKKAVGWAQENQALAKLQDAPIRWICDDAVKFCAREKRRGNIYDIILLDPPAYGRGPKGEVWQLFDHLPYMLDLVRDLQSTNPLLTILTSYAIRASHFALHELVQDVFAGFDGRLESGELVLQQELGGRSLSTSMFSRIIAKGAEL